jgi:hypothetical protein
MRDAVFADTRGACKEVYARHALLRDGAPKEGDRYAVPTHASKSALARRDHRNVTERVTRRYGAAQATASRCTRYMP